MIRKECIYCIKRKTEYCPNSSECYLLENVPYFQTKYDVLKENQELKKQLETKETQQKEFIRWLEKEIVDSKNDGSQQYYTMQHLRLFKEIIGDKE